MAQDDGDAAFLPGPLDELVPGLRRKADKLPALPVHPRVVRPRRADGSSQLVMLSFRPAQNARALHAALKPMIEAALLSELCRPPEELANDYARLSELTLLMFEEQGFDARTALAPFGLEQADVWAGDAAQALALARRESLLLADPVRDEPLLRYRAHVESVSSPLVRSLHATLLEHGPRAAWGREPGRLARALSDWLAAHGAPGVEPSRAGIERLESLIIPQEPGVIRFIEPLLFQGLCDLVAVYAASRAHLAVEWGVCEPDPETGLAPPPVLRVTRDGESFHVPLGEHVLRWCVMPVARGEAVPSLGAWAEHEFL